MLSININQNVEQYREPVAFGLDAKQTLAAFFAIMCGVAITCLLHFVCGLPIEISIWLSLPVCVPIMLPVLGKKHGLTVVEQFRGSNKRTNVLAYEAKLPGERKDIQKDGSTAKTQRTKRDKRRKEKKKNAKTRSVSANQK
ncbi:MAG: PrgI family protein [Roseburia sp.]|nr:PrgI family protein [Roseburia sp.]